MSDLWWYAGLFAVATAFVAKGAAMLERSTGVIARHYGLPAVVTGALLVAIGSSFPELATAIVATTVHGEFSLGLSVVVGSAIFNILVIPAVSVLASARRCEVSRAVVFKEALFYLLSIAIVLLTLALSVIYAPATTSGGDLAGRLDRKLALVPLAAYGLYLFLQWQDSKDERASRERVDGSIARPWLSVALSLVAITAGVEGLIRCALAFGDALGTSSFVWGLTVVAVATSLPDAVASVQAARHDRDDVSLANVFGSNVFDLLVVVPVGVMIAGSTVVSFSLATPTLAVLTLATTLLFVVLRTDMAITRREAVVLLAAYAAFVAWVVLEASAVIDTVHGLPPASAS